MEYKIAKVRHWFHRRRMTWDVNANGLSYCSICCMIKPFNAEDATRAMVKHVEPILRKAFEEKASLV